MPGEALAAAVVPDDTACAFQGVLDLRRVCAGVMGVGGGSVRFYVQYERWVDS